jgi:hypothetical protein
LMPTCRDQRPGHRQTIGIVAEKRELHDGSLYG